MTIDEQFDTLILTLRSYLKQDELTLIGEAFRCANIAHEGQLRKSGELYITHPLEVAQILADLEVDAASICAALLHDTLEDTKLSTEEISNTFGYEILSLVEGVTKLGKVYFKSKEEAEAENYRKMFVAMAKDIRVIVIKLADRLHNMRTLKFQPTAKQKKISLETRDIFSPLAHRLGMWRLKWELEDLAFYYLEPEQFQKIKKLIVMKRENREAYVEEFCDSIRNLLNEAAVTGIVKGRPKHFYSIYTKLKEQNLEFDELFDTLGIRIIVDSEKDCYSLLGMIHAKYKPISGRFKDYIAMPKSNLYQSLHTTVMGPLGKPVEVQIRTKKMHEIAEYGIAAHWHYKEGVSPANYDGDLSWLRKIIELQQEKLEPKAFLQGVKFDLFIEEVFVFTPKGDMKMLEAGSTIIDFAYFIHTEIGQKCSGAKVNGKSVSLAYVLQNGDRARILTDVNATPQLEWLYVAKTVYAKNTIRKWLKRQAKLRKVDQGQRKLEAALAANGVNPHTFFTNTIQQKSQEIFNVKDLDKLFYLVGEGSISTAQIVKALVPETNLDAVSSADIPEIAAVQDGKYYGVFILFTEESVNAQVASCCNPIPGDPVVGEISEKTGLVVHRQGCGNVKDSKQLIEDICWKDAVEAYIFPVRFCVETLDRQGILLDIVSEISTLQINITEIMSSKKKKGMTQISCEVEVTHLTQYQDLKAILEGLPDVVGVSRIELS